MHSEKPLRIFAENGDALVFPAVPDADEWFPSSRWKLPVVDAADWQGVSAARYIQSPLLPPGWTHEWSLGENGVVKCEFPVGEDAPGTVLRVTGRLHGQADISVTVTQEWEARQPPPIPGSSETRDYPVDMFEAGWEDEAGWVGFEFDMEVPARASKGMVTLSVESNESSAIFDLQVEAPASSEQAQWACLPAAEGHLEGLWSLPQLQGDIRENILYGGGLAPAEVKYGPRPVSYRLLCAGASRRKVNMELRRVMAVLSQGSLETDNNGYGWTRFGYLAAPPSVEWKTNRRYMVEIDMTITYLAPGIYGAKGQKFSDYLRWFDGSRGHVETDMMVFTGWEPWTLAVEDAGKPRALFTVTNNGTVPLYPYVGVKLAPFTTWLSNEDRSGFGIAKITPAPPPDEEIATGRQFADIVWFAANPQATGKVVYWPPSGEAYRLDGTIEPKWADWGDAQSIGKLRIEPGETARYVVCYFGDANIGIPETQLNNEAALLFVASTY